jgi:hypothetical protein
MVEEIITALSRFKSLLVIARNASPRITAAPPDDEAATRGTARPGRAPRDGQRHEEEISRPIQMKRHIYLHTMRSWQRSREMLK